MKAFAYKSARSEEEASKLLGAGGVALAGGTSLLNLLKGFVVQPETVVDLKRVPGIEGIEVSSAGVRVGAATRIIDLIEHAELSKRLPVLTDAAASIASPQIRNMGTIGGNLCQRPACWYFTQESFDCLKRGGTSCPAKAGENEFHAIFDTDGPCVMVHPSTLAPALMALDARVRVRGKDGARELPLSELFVSPKVSAQTETILGPGEWITHVLIPPAPAASATVAIGPREANDWSIASASVALTLDGGRCVGARVVLGGVAPTPWISAAAQEALKGKAITPEVAAAAGAAAVTGASPLAQNGYKVAVTQAAVQRAVLRAQGRA